ncbi:hypothetical protein X975_27013, partial [Stegodyphus mimosarum]
MMKRSYCNNSEGTSLLILQQFIHQPLLQSQFECFLQTGYCRKQSAFSWSLRLSVLPYSLLHSTSTCNF